MTRKSEISRKTKETDIQVSLNIDGNGNSTIESGNGFMDHMLALFSKHGLFDLECICKGDLEVDFHHSAEDIGICLGRAVKEALGDMRGIVRYATTFVPMDESLARVCLDICGRSNVVYEVTLLDRKINDFECDLAEDFFKAFTDHSRITLHVDLLRGRNSHHSLEAVFKAFGKALATACTINPRTPQDIPTTKGVL
ncbi:MAG: imidazoleglycerol-phosphate dehydratase HisB [Chitinivibrionales bacterium]|nr:imidazoleglycerol-phosphate dehydratase HisB [Chitinivibrionales bacterium]